MIEQTRSPLASRPPPAPEAPPPLPETPFVGLVPFEVGDAPFFFGRERERRLIAANLMASRLTLLYGPSGVGKSSVLRAGVEHDLRERARRDLARGILPEWVPVVFASWSDDPLPALRKGIASTLAETFGELAPKAPDADRLDEVLAGWIERLDALAGPEEDDRRLRLLIVLDQFEEYFLYHGDKAGEGSLAVELPRAVNREGLRANFAISIREDAYAQLDRFKGRIPNLFESYFRIRQLERSAAERAVTEPIEVYNARLPANEKPFAIEPELVRAVLDQVKTGTVVLGQAGEGTVGETTDSRIEAPFLQLVMRRLWNDARSRGDRTLSLARLRELGGADSIVGAHLNEAMEELDPAERSIAARVFRQLVTPSGTKIAHTLADLADFADVHHDELRPMLLKLSSSRILRHVEPPPGDIEPRYEIFHDVLAAAVLDWHAAHVREQEEAERRRADRRRLRGRLIKSVGGLLAVATIAVAGLAVWALSERKKARDAADESTSLSLAAASSAVLASELDDALLLGLEAFLINPSAETRGSMIDALAEARRSGLSAILRGHAGTVASVAFSQDRRTVASGGADGLRVWDIAARRQVTGPFGAAAGDLSRVAFRADGRTLASAGSDGVRLWDVIGRKQLGRPLGGAAGPASAVAFSADGRTLAFALEDGTLRLWDMVAGRASGAAFGMPERSISSLAFSPQGYLLASADDDERVRLWDVRRPGRLIAVLHGELDQGPVLTVAFTPDGTTLASAGADGKVRLWHVASRRQVTVLSGGTASIRSVAFAPDGRTLAAGSDDRVRIWDLRRRLLVSERPGPAASVAFSDDGRTLAAAGDETVTLWNLHAGGLGASLGSHNGRVSSVAVSPDGQIVASGGDDRVVQLRNVADGSSANLAAHEEAVTAVAFSQDGGTLASADRGGTVRLWNVRTRAQMSAGKGGHIGSVLSVAFSPDGTMLASAGEDAMVRLWDVEDRRALEPPLHGHLGRVQRVAFGEDRESLVSAGEDGTVRLWDVRDRTEVGPPLRVTSGFVLSVAFTADAKMLASARDDGTVRLWNLRERKPAGPAAATGELLSVAFSSDGRMLAAGGDGTVQLWDVEEREPIGMPLEGHIGPVESVAFAPHGLSFVTGGADGTVRAWRGVLWSDAEDLRARVCNLVVGNLTEEEWEELIPRKPYAPACPR